jgi:multidrug efflux system membrane fusion protein
MIRTQAALGALLIVAGGLAGCKNRAAEQPRRPVKTKAVEQLSVTVGSRYSASIAPGNQIELAFKVGGYVVAIEQVRGVDAKMRHIQGGDFVRRGTVLARVRQSDYQIKVDQAQSRVAEAQFGLDATKAQSAQAQQAVETAKAQLAEAEAAFSRAKLEFERAKSLFASQSITKTDYDGASTQHDVAQARVAVARSNVRSAEAAARVGRAQIEVSQARTKGSREMVTEARIPLGDTSLRAPVDSTILRRDFEVGSLVAAGKPAFVLANVGLVKAVFGVPDRAVGALKLGVPLTVTTEALPGTEFTGQITAIAPAADPKSRVFDVEITIPNPGNLLKVGMVVSIQAEGGSPPATDILVVPLNAIVQSKERPGGYALFVVETQGAKQVARLRNVKLGEAYGNTVAVLEGVKLGEQVITTGATLVIDGEPVEVIP